MPDFDQLLAQQRANILNPQRARRDVIRAGLQATADVPYAEAIGDIEAEKFNRVLQGYNILAAEREFQATEEQRQFERGAWEQEFAAGEKQREFTRGMETRRFSFEQEQALWERAQAEAARGDANAKVLVEGARALATDEASAQSLAAWVIDQTETGNIEDPAAIPGLLQQGVEALDLPTRTGLASEMVTPGATIGTVDPETGEFEPQYTGPFAPRTPLVSIEQTEETAYAKEGGKRLVEAQEAATQTLANARRLQTNVQTLESVLTRTETGKLRGWFGSVAALGSDLGIDVPAVAGRLGVNIDEPADTETIQRITAEMILGRLGELRLAPVSDLDMQMLARGTAGLLKTREDNLRFVEAINNSIGVMQNTANLTLEAKTWEDYIGAIQDYYNTQPIETRDFPMRAVMPDGRFIFYDELIDGYRYEDTYEAVE